MNPFTLSTPTDLRDDTFARLQGLIKSLTGVHIAENKKQLVFSRLRMRLRDLGLSDFESYEARLTGAAGRAEREVFVDLLTTHETYFFREPTHFEFLKTLLPAQKMSALPFRVWSAACSTGEEAYSIAMVLADGLGTSTRWEILGSDVSIPAVERALEGRYLNQRMDGIPLPFQKRYMQAGTGDLRHYRFMAEELKRQMTFRPINLNAELPSIGQFDVVFLRNMLIYFEPETKLKIIRRLIEVIKPGGYLFTGHTEYLRDIDPKLKAIAAATYQWRA